MQSITMLSLIVFQYLLFIFQTVCYSFRTHYRFRDTEGKGDKLLLSEGLKNPIQHQKYLVRSADDFEKTTNIL